MTDHAYVPFASAKNAVIGPARCWVVVPTVTDHAALLETLLARSKDPASTRYVPRGNAENFRSTETAPPFTVTIPEDEVAM